MRTSDEACIFCSLPRSAIVVANAHAFAVRDKTPVTPLHSLVLPRRHVADYFALDAAEKQAIHELLAELREDIRACDPSVRGFNIGINIGAAAGQTVFHCHAHLVPRREGDGAGLVLDGKAKRLIPL